jgi:hypothetical protein
MPRVDEAGDGLRERQHRPGSEELFELIAILSGQTFGQVFGRSPHRGVRSRVWAGLAPNGAYLRQTWHVLAVAPGRSAPSKKRCHVELVETSHASSAPHTFPPQDFAPFCSLILL